MELDLKNVVQVLLRNIVLILLVAILCGTGVALYTQFCVTPMYRSNALLSLEYNNESLTDSQKMNTGVLYAGYFAEMAAKERVMNNAAGYIESNVYTGEQIKSMVSVTASKEYPLISIVAENADPQHACKIAEAVAISITKYITTDSKFIVSVEMAPKQSVSPYSPSLISNTVIGFVVGLVLSCAAVIIVRVLYNKITTEDELADILGVPIVGSVPLIDISLKNIKSNSSAEAKGEAKK